jgi:putative hydrolases of HD superfamily
MQAFQNIIKFIELMHQFQKVKRRVLIIGTDAQENDIEHSYQLGMAAWYVVVSQKLHLDPDKVLKYGLVHDLVEVYAGDTYAYDTDQTVLDSKVSREAEAATQLQREFPDFPDLHEYIDGYKHLADAEARLVYALDKLLPMINGYLDGGRGWKKEGVTLEMIKNLKADKIALSPEMKVYFDHLIVTLEKKESELFERKIA